MVFAYHTKLIYNFPYKVAARKKVTRHNVHLLLLTVHVGPMHGTTDTAQIIGSVALESCAIYLRSDFSHKYFCSAVALLLNLIRNLCVMIILYVMHYPLPRNEMLGKK